VVGSNADLRVCRFRAGDEDAVDRLLRAAYRVDASYSARIDAHLRQRDGLPLVAVLDGRVVGAVFGSDYATSAYVALMGVDPAFQGRGIASALMTALLAWAEERGFHDVRLDASKAGVPLYERCGFVDVAETIVCERVSGGVSSRVAATAIRDAYPTDRASLFALDAGTFGADRSAMLEPLLARHDALIAEDGRGYVVVQRSPDAAVIGPWIAIDAEAARDLFDAALARVEGLETKLFVSSASPDAMRIAEAAGFVARRSLRHMIRGRAVPLHPALLGRVNLGQG
jgi:GNAT superfamily N-acetyltransferase